MTVADRHDHWARHATQWSHVGPPLRPGAEDIAAASELVATSGWDPDSRSPRALVLGVTPELVGMDWPSGTRLTAIDRCPGMIGALLPSKGRQGPGGICGNWLKLPFASGSFDLVVGDGCLTVLESAADHGHFFAELARVMTVNGRLVLRLFVRPEVADSPERVIADLQAGRIGNFHVFKWRLAMALVYAQTGAVAVADIWQAWHDSEIVAAELSERLGWPLAQIETIEAYRGASARYTFPRLDEVRAMLGVNFDELACLVPQYELGDRCPTLLLAPQS
jgi:SAM-dependent methyltransferase